MSFRFDIIYEYREMFLIGALTTLGLTFVATLGGTLLGLVGALARIVRFEKGGPLLTFRCCMSRCSAARLCLCRFLFGITFGAWL